MTASNNYQKERQFRAIEEKEKEYCTAVRNNVETVLEAEEVVVGMRVIFDLAFFVCSGFVFPTFNNSAFFYIGLSS